MDTNIIITNVDTADHEDFFLVEILADVHLPIINKETVVTNVYAEVLSNGQLYITFDIEKLGE